MRNALEDAGVIESEDMELIIEALDGDHSGIIEYSEFAAGCIDIANDGIRKQLRVAFDVFDLDGSGFLSLDELKQVLTVGPNADVVPIRPSSRGGGVLQTIQTANASY